LRLLLNSSFIEVRLPANDRFWPVSAQVAIDPFRMVVNHRDQSFRAFPIAARKQMLRKFGYKL
jgi:hypothetical protein